MIPVIEKKKSLEKSELNVHPIMKRKMRRKVWENFSLSTVEMGW